jgi:hypothetical protein
MAFASLRFEDRLVGASNFLSWKVRVTLLLEKNDLWDIVKDVVPMILQFKQQIHNSCQLTRRK